jgi:DNA polymerase
MVKSTEPNVARVLLQKEMFGDELFTPWLETAPEPQTEMSENVVENITLSEPVAEYVASQTKSTVYTPETDSLETLNRQICNCQECPLGASRKKFVFGVGNPAAKVMLIGEGPGAEEDAQGEPFVGKAGKLLNDILKAIKFSREEVYIANIVKCRPPENRKPTPDEIARCLPYLHKQIELVNPRLILCLGATAAEGLLNLHGTLRSMRSKEYAFRDKTVMVTYHPAALLRTPAYKRDTWEDVQAFRKLYDNL